MVLDGAGKTLVIPSSGQNGWLTFTGTQGQRIQLQTTGATDPRLLDPGPPNGTVMYTRSAVYGLNGLVDTTVLPDTGTYSIKVDPNDTATGSVTFKAWTVPDDIDAGDDPRRSSPHPLTTVAPGQNGKLTFTATQGQRIQLQTTGATMPGSWTLVRPNGTVMYTRSAVYGLNGLVDTTVLPDTGTYSIKVDPNDTATGLVTFKASDRARRHRRRRDDPRRSSPHPHHRRTRPERQAHLHRNPGTTDPAPDHRRHHARLLDPGPTQRHRHVHPLRGLRTQRPRRHHLLPDTGTYSIKVDPNDTATGSVTFKAWTVPDDIDAGEMILDGAARTLTTVAPGQNGKLTFTATQGQRIQLQTTGATMPGSWTLVRPNGTVMYTRSATYGLNVLMAAVLPDDGTYSIKVYPNDITTGSVTYRLFTAP